MRHLITALFSLFVDINECSSNNGGCSHSCYNIPGSFYCGCPEGTTMASNNLTCIGKWRKRRVCWKAHHFQKAWKWQKSSTCSTVDGDLIGLLTNDYRFNQSRTLTCKRKPYSNVIITCLMILSFLFCFVF